ncbi:MAG: DUF2225 domain-containing protein [candidate division Zixibacteria bacterium]|nr:DUF2225 domain-containing protein [candidate division Zixibacteria bacterium]MBU1471583.1 DUF2225 domain-containing protein [candidate division Zixibacteria bacterium]MBU2624819.1 DUF2225 domain-containing protein [candidate division Zixibacteria bacterium]
MTHDSPLYLQKIECPVCKTVNEFDTIKVGAYVEGGRDTDFCPTEIKWKDTRYQRFHPLLYFMATCSSCFFTREYTAKFKDWKNDTAFRNYKLAPMKQKHALILAEDQNVIKMLGDNIDIQKCPHQTAINKLLLGIYDEMLSDRPSVLDVARYFVRVGWMFRECTSPKSEVENIYFSYVSNLEDHVRNLDSIYNKFEDVRLKLHNSVKNHLEDTGFTTEAISGELREGYSQALAFLSGAGERLEASVRRFQEMIRISTDSIQIVGDDDVFATPYGGYDSYREFLKQLRTSWDFVPLSEHDALRMSFRFYKNAYEAGHQVSSGNQQIQVEYILGELCRRLGTHDEAKKYFNAAIRSSQEFVYQNKGDMARTALARKILELALAQGKLNLKESEKV